MSQFFKHILFLNLLAFVVVWALTVAYPMRVLLSVQSEQSVVYAADADRSVEFRAGNTTEKFFLPTDFTQNALVFTRIGGEGRPTAISARLMKRLVLPFVVPVSQNASGDGFRLDMAHARLDTGSKVLWLLLAGLELTALFLSFLFALFRKCLTGDPQQTCGPAALTSSWRESLLVAFVVALFFTVLVPVQTYLGNAAALGFGFGELAAGLVVPFLATCVVFVLVLEAGRRCAGALLSVLVVSLVVCGYLETGILAHDYPELNGETIFFYNRTRGLLDLAVFPLVFLSLLIARIKCRPALIWVSLGALVMSAAASFDAAKPAPKKQTSDLNVSFVPSDAIVRSCRHSAVKNVAVYILDSVSTPHALAILEQDPELRAAFDGFTCYTNNIGMLISTVPGVAGLVTGNYYEDPATIGEYAFSCFTSKSFLKDYLDAGAGISYAPGSYGFGVSSWADALGRDGSPQPSAPTDNSVWFRRMDDAQPWNLFEIVRFRLAPFLAKPYVMGYTASGWAARGIAGSERAAFPLIAAAPQDANLPLTLQLWHTVGSHGPSYVTRNGIRAPQLKGYEAKIETSWHALRQFAQHIAALKRNGLYDNTYLVLTADHGSTPILPSGEDADEPFERRHEEIAAPSGRMLPILWVKPLNAQGAMRFSDVPTSHARIAPLVRSLCMTNLDAEATTALLASSNRLYRVDDGSCLVDCHVDATNGLTFTRTSVGKSLEELPPIRLNHAYSLYATNFDDVPPVKFDQAFFFNADGPRMTSMVQPTRFGFKVPQANADYVVSLTLRYPDDRSKVNDDGSLLLFTDDVTGVQTPYAAKVAWPDPEIFRLSVKSDSAGFVRFGCVGKSCAEILALEVGLDL